MPDNINREQYIITYDTSDLKRALDDVKRLQEAIDKLGAGGTGTGGGASGMGGGGGTSSSPGTYDGSAGGGGGGRRSRGPSIAPQVSDIPYPPPPPPPPTPGVYYNPNQLPAGPSYLGLPPPLRPGEMRGSTIYGGAYSYQPNFTMGPEDGDFYHVMDGPRRLGPGAQASQRLLMPPSLPDAYYNGYRSPIMQGGQVGQGLYLPPAGGTYSRRSVGDEMAIEQGLASPYSPRARPFRSALNMPGDEDWTADSKYNADRTRQSRRDYITANSQRGVAAGNEPDWNEGVGGKNQSGMSRFWSGSEDGGAGFAKSFQKSIMSPEVWGNHTAWLLQSAVLYQVTGLIGKVFEGIGTVVETSMNAATASSRLQMISGQGGGGALGGLLGAGAAYGLGPSDIFGISSQLTTLGMATPGGANALTRTSASSTAYGLFQNPLQAAQLYAQAGGTYGMTPGASQDLALRALRGGAPDPAATLAGGMGLAGSGAMSVPASVGLLTAIQRTTGLPADAATSVAEALMNNPATALYASTVVGLPGGGTRPAGLDAILPQLTRTYATGTPSQRQAISGLAGEANRVALQDILTNPQFAATQAQIANDENATRDARLAERNNIGLNLGRIASSTLGGFAQDYGPFSLGGMIQAAGRGVNYLGGLTVPTKDIATQSQQDTYAEHDIRMKAAYAAGNISGPGGILGADGSSPTNKFTGNGGVITAGDYNRLMKIYATVEAKLVGTPGYNAEENMQRADYTIIGTPGNPMYTKMDKLDRVALTQAMQIAAMGLVGMQNMPGNFLQQNLEGAIVSGQLGFSSMTNKSVFSGGNRPADPFIVSRYTNAYNDYRAGERNPGAWTGGAGGGQSTSTAQPDQPPYTPTPTTGNVYLNGQKVGEAMSAVSEVDMDRTLRSNYSAGNGNAPVLGAPIP